MDKILFSNSADFSAKHDQSSEDDNLNLLQKENYAKFIIERFDHYFEGVNNKASFYIGLNTFIFGGMCAGYLGVYNSIDVNVYIWILFAAVILCNSISIYLTILAMMPFLKNTNSDQDFPSLTYFGGISNHTLGNYRDKFYKCSDRSMLDDLIQQIYCLALGLDRKYKKLKMTSHLVLAQFLLMLPLFYLIIKNLKP